eukprot:TRINITY_DN11488_c0_g1_i1.p1 TRINITY_DN11488_c0_g1~~TRINITY_DN11488_c0_g1_i1.p1  ORF type:complete len:579 (-),score=155.58 TRINITY_DN11488_c0_g1_i1:371-2107(-)
MAASFVERATSDMLVAPDWSMNLEICDLLNGDPGQTKDVIKAIKKRITHKNPKVQILALTLLESLMQNCGDNVHQQVADRDVPHDLVKIVKKKPDFSVREKILVLLDAWQEAFGGSGGKYPQYYSAYNELVRAGIEFPPRPENFAPLYTPPQTQPVTSHQPQTYIPTSYEDEFQASAVPDSVGFSLSDIENARGSMNLLAEMLNALDPFSKEGINQEVITELVERCRTCKQQVLHLVNTTQDEELLGKGLALNDDLDGVLSRYNAIVSGYTVTWPKTSSTSKPVVTENPEDDETEDDTVQLSRRSSKAHTPSQERSVGNKLPLIPPPPGLKKEASSSVQKEQMDFLSGESYDSPVAPSAVESPGGGNQNLFPSGPRINSCDRDVSESLHSPSRFTQQQPTDRSENNSFATFLTNKGDQQQFLQQGKGSQLGNTTEPPEEPNIPHKSPTTLPPAPWDVHYAQNMEVAHGQGRSSYENNEKSSIPPPPSKYSQRQQFFQEQLASGSGQYTSEYSEADHDNILRRTQNLSLQGGSHSAYGTSYSQQPLASSKDSKTEDKLFGDLVDFAKVKQNLSKKGSGL